ncbi:hypothetical protein D1AOALGA4SA_8063 [Olavius algarvensis Delta 1 endosymbiont]|nr:hypothetical protein D1AOALGA4SA_8063 [Olavius algarvensis Delta 1 endosymbiont]
METQTLKSVIKLHEFLSYFRDLVRTTVSAKPGRHGGRPYVGK